MLKVIVLPEDAEPKEGDIVTTRGMIGTVDDCGQLVIKCGDETSYWNIKEDYKIIMRDGHMVVNGKIPDIDKQVFDRIDKYVEEQAQKGGVVEVCPDCDIDGCHHLRKQAFDSDTNVVSKSIEHIEQHLAVDENGLRRCECGETARCERSVCQNHDQYDFPIEGIDFVSYECICKSCGKKGKSYLADSDDGAKFPMTFEGRKAARNAAISAWNNRASDPIIKHLLTVIKQQHEALEGIEDYCKEEIKTSEIECLNDSAIQTLGAVSKALTLSKPLLGILEKK